MLSSSATSSARNLTSPLIDDAAWAPVLGSRAVRMIRHPLFASRRTISLPIPRLPPVTNAIFPVLITDGVTDMEFGTSFTAVQNNRQVDRLVLYSGDLAG